MSEWKQQRERIALGATNTLMNYMNAHYDKTRSAHVINTSLIHGRPNVPIKKLRKSPLIMFGKFCDTKKLFMRTAFWAELSRCKESKWFDDEGICVWYTVHGEDQSQVLITRHAVQRAFERAWWFFKDKPVEDWLDSFNESAYLVLSKMYYRTEQKFTISNDVLNVVVQKDARGAVIRTYTPPTERISK